MYCRYCGQKLNDGAKFCSNCGQSLQENKQTKAEPVKAKPKTQAKSASSGAAGNKTAKQADAKASAKAKPAQNKKTDPPKTVKPVQESSKKEAPVNKKKKPGILTYALIGAGVVIGANVLSEGGDEFDPYQNTSGGYEQEYTGWASQDYGSSYDDYGSSDDYSDSADWDFDDGFKPFLDNIPTDPATVSYLAQKMKENMGGEPAVEHVQVVSLSEEMIDYYVQLEGENVIRERSSKVAHRQNPDVEVIEVEHFELPVTNDITKEEFNRRVEEYVRRNGPQDVWAENYDLD